jgi:hypothetical protein
VQIDAAILHFSLLNGSVEPDISTVDPGRPLLWAARRPFNDYQQSAQMWCSGVRDPAWVKGKRLQYLIRK